MTSTEKVFTQGTHRVRQPEETWDVVAPKMERYGVTRVSDVTGLDTLGIPVAMAARPEAWTLCVSQGKGQSLTLAKVSAMMECIELWHAERARPPVTVTAAAAVLDLPYRLADLGVATGPLLSEQTPLKWCEATGMVSGKPVPVPIDSVMFPNPRSQTWTGAELTANSNGLASGNMRAEAEVHALYEVIERDALCRLSATEVMDAPAVELDSIPDPTCRVMVEALRATGGKIIVQSLPNVFGIPTARALAWSWDFPMPCGGYGSHSDPLVAISRAVTEAAQARLAAIVGSRDDLEDYYSYINTTLPKPDYLGMFASPTQIDFTEIGSATNNSFVDIAEERDWLAGHVTQKIGTEPLVIDLSTDPDFSVVKVIVPRAWFSGERLHNTLDRYA